MILAIDHVVIYVRDLEAASSDYASLGFTVVPGGEHTGGMTHNALVVFQDGTYLELIASRGPLSPDHFFYRPHGLEGLVTYALLPSDIAEEIEAARERGLHYDGPTPGGRVRPDGRRIEWQTAKPSTPDLPFLCADITPRELRVPAGPASTHPNGIVGIANVMVLVEDIDASVARYNALLGKDPKLKPAETGGAIATFAVGDARLVVMQPTDEPMRDYLAQRGEGPYALILRTGPDATPIPLDLQTTHGVNIGLVPAETPVAKRTVSREEMVKVRSIAEEYAYIGGLRCDNCGGRYGVVAQSLVVPTGEVPRDEIELVCHECAADRMVIFDISSFYGK